MRISQKRARELVKNGVDFLDANIADWWKEIDLEKLDLSECACCIEGQLLGLSDSPDKWARVNNLLGISGDEYGFNLPNEYHSRKEPNPNWKILTDAWIGAVREKKAKVAA